MRLPGARLHQPLHTGVALLTFACLAAALLAAPDSASAFEEPNAADGSGCAYCHGVAEEMDCESCHGATDDTVGPDNGYEQAEYSGPHSGYTTTSDKCDNCHQVHRGNADSLKLLPAATIVETCFSCHDGTGGFGVYGTVEARTGNAAPGGHSHSRTNVVPGGAADGADAARVFEGPGGMLICTDCHSPHGADVVSEFTGDRRRLRAKTPNITSTRLLKRRPTGASVAVDSYGSDWCLACHAGRGSGGTTHNHPVESVSTTASPYDYARLPVLDRNTETSETVLGGLGGVQLQPDGTPQVSDAHDCPESGSASYNRGYLMPYPRTGLQEGHFPICQQCHEDSRSVGTLTPDGSAADATEAYVEAGDGVFWSGGSWANGMDVDNPAIQNFPHETLNEDMLVETADDLCTNCHPEAKLP